MKNALSLILLGVILLSSGCALLQHGAASGSLNTYDGVSGGHGSDATELARQTADELSRRYPPGRTSVALIKVPGAFGDTLEAELRQRGFALLPVDATGGVKVSYVLDKVGDESSCYLQVSASDGTRFGYVRSLNQTSASTTSGPTSDPAGTLSIAAPTVSPLSAPVAPEPLPMPSASARDSAPSAKRVPLRLAVLHQLPHNWRYTIMDVSRRELPVGEPSHSDWRANVSFAAEQAGCRATFDDDARRVTVSAVHDAPVPSVSAARTVLSSPTATIMPATGTRETTSTVLPQQAAGVTSPALPPSPVLPPNESESAPMPAPMSPTVATALDSALGMEQTSAPVLKDEDAISVLEAEPTLEQWTLSPGSLYAQLEAWCERAGFQLVWKPAHDLDMEARAEFRGGFTDAVGRLFQGLHKSGNALRVTIYTANNVVEISEE